MFFLSLFISFFISWCIWGYELSNEYHLLALQSDENLIVEAIRSCLVKRVQLDIQLVQDDNNVTSSDLDVKGCVLGVAPSQQQW